MLLFCVVLVLLSFLFGFFVFFFFFKDTATTEIYTLSLHDALPISRGGTPRAARPRARPSHPRPPSARDRKSTRLNSSHGYISYAVFCSKKKSERRTSGHQPHLGSPTRPSSLWRSA